VDSQRMTPSGRFACRYQDCDKTFKWDYIPIILSVNLLNGE
jgi:hypothetical protein